MKQKTGKRYSEAQIIRVLEQVDQGAPSVVLFEKHLFAASFLVLMFSKKAGFSLTKVNKVTDSVQHSH